MKECATRGIPQIVTRFNHPKGHADTKRMMRTLNEELIWSNKFDRLKRLRVALNAWGDDDNAHYVHSTLG